jgi:osmotically inducible protein OsmC
MDGQSQHEGDDMAAVRRAEATWSGDLTSGQGSVSAISSGAFSDLPVTWAARTESSDGKTSPEELVAAAHAVRGVVPGMSEEDFVTAAEAARDGCPISGALKGNVALSVDAALAS